MNKYMLVNNVNLYALVNVTEEKEVYYHPQTGDVIEANPRAVRSVQMGYLSEDQWEQVYGR